MTVYSIQQSGLEFLEDAVSRGRQSWKRETTVSWHGHKIRAVIDRDSYDFQSRIYSEVFSPSELKWNRVQSLSGKDHDHLPSAYTKDDRDGTVEILTETNGLMNDLIAYAQQILDGATA